MLVGFAVKKISRRVMGEKSKDFNPGGEGKIPHPSKN